MECLFHRWLLPVWFFCAVLPIQTVLGASASIQAQNSSTGKRWTRFELTQTGPSGDLQTGKTVALTITLGGVSQGSLPVVAICESALFESQTVTLEPEGNELILKGDVTLEPMPMSLTSVHQKAARIQVTFARFRQDKFERFMRRIVYVTLDRQDQPGESFEAPPAKAEESSGGDLVTDEVQPNALSVSEAEVAEEDLVPFSDPGQGKAYWQHVSQLVSRSWARQVRGIKRGPGSETVRVHFQLYPGGRAQLIEIEKGSGARVIDEAGIFAIVNAQPFPPFPPELGDEAVDVHVRMRTGARPKPRDVQAVTGQSSSQPAVTGARK